MTAEMQVLIRIITIHVILRERSDRKDLGLPSNELLIHTDWFSLPFLKNEYVLKNINNL
jgi:hypothetical protein